MSVIKGPCPKCGRPIADHLVSEWVACSGGVDHLDYEDVPDGPIPFRLEGRDIAVADNLTVRALLSEPVPGTVIPVLLLTFEVSMIDGRHHVSEVALVAGDVDGMRKFGKLLRDGAFGAANGVEKVRR